MEPSTAHSSGSKYHLPTNIKISLLIFTLAGSFILVGLPHGFHGATHAGIIPPFHLFLVSGLLMIMLTAGLFAYLSKSGLGWRKTALLLALGYNATLAVIKLCLAPMALYLASQHASLNAEFLSPNSSAFYYVVGVGILAIYLLAFRLMYNAAKSRYRRATDDPTLHDNSSGNRHVWGIGMTLLIIGGLVLFGGALIIIPLALLGSGWNYLGYVFGALAGPIVLAIGIAIVLAQAGFKDVEEQAIALRNPALLASFFWVGVSLIVLYHVMWVVFMVTLVQLWPFNTYSPK